MVETGVVHDRFQILHLKHMEYLLAAKMRCKKLYIGISNPDDSYINESDMGKIGFTKKANPFTYMERMEMIRDALLDFGVKREEFEIVPFPIGRPEYLLQYVPKDATYFLGSCEAWGEDREKLLADMGLEVSVLWRRAPEEMGVTSTEVRSCIVKGLPWKHLVPHTVYEYIQVHGLDDRIRRLYENPQEEEIRQLQEKKKEEAGQEL